MKRLFDGGLDVNAMTEATCLSGQKMMSPALCTAVAYGQEAAVRFLLDRGANPNLPTSNGYTPLMGASLEGYLPLMRLLMEAKANVDVVQPGTGGTAFHATCIRNRPDCAEALVRAGCDTSIRDTAGITGRDAAKEQGHTAVLERLDALAKAETD